MEKALSHDRRDFLYVATGAVGTAITGAAVWPLIDALNPSADVTALSSVEINLAGVLPGSRITVKWRGKPVFIDHRTPERIAAARAEMPTTLPDPESDEERVQRDEWLILVGVCTHLGCIPLGQSNGDAIGKWGGWFCPCHGSHYDMSGRVRRRVTLRCRLPGIHRFRLGHCRRTSRETAPQVGALSAAMRSFSLRDGSAGEPVANRKQNGGEMVGCHKA